MSVIMKPVKKHTRSKEKRSLRRKKLRKKQALRRVQEKTDVVQKKSSENINTHQSALDIVQESEESVVSTANSTTHQTGTKIKPDKGLVLNPNNSRLLRSTYAGKVLLAARPEIGQSSAKLKRNFRMNEPHPTKPNHIKPLSLLISPRPERPTDSLNPTLLQECDKKIILGEGRFGIVRLMRYRTNLVAVKTIKQQKYCYLIEKEAQLLSNLDDHPGFPYFYGICEKNGNKLLVMEFCGENGKVVTLNGALLTRVITDDSCWPTIIYSLAMSIAHMHSKGFIHCDIHGSNVLMFRRNGVWCPVVVDFGKTIHTHSMQPRSRNTDRDPEDKQRYPHIAPELLDGTAIATAITDAYSFGRLASRICRKVRSCKVYEKIANECYTDDALMRLSIQGFIDKFDSLQEK